MMAPHPTLRRSRARRQQGISLVELMVGITVGLVIIAAMALLFANSSRSRQETEKAGTKIDNGRYALDVLARDLEHAGFLAELDPRQLGMPTAKPSACESGVTALKAALVLPVLGFDDTSASQLGGTGFSCITDATPGTDIIVVRRAATCASVAATTPPAECTGLQADTLTFQASSCNESSELGGLVVENYYRFTTFSSTTLTLRQRDCSTRANLHRYILRAYYIAKNDQAGDAIPSLKMVELGTNGAWGTPVTLVQGIENLQVEWGLDTNNDGTPDLYATDPDKYCSTVSPVVPAGTCWSLAVSAKLFVLSRNVEASPGHNDTKVYVLGKAGNATTGVITAADKTAGPFNNNFKRNAFGRAVVLQNVSSRRLTP